MWHFSAIHASIAEGWIEEADQTDSVAADIDGDKDSDFDDVA
jgi:hypothetical protein